MTFEIIPAIDLRGGRCVRLYQGDYDRETVYSADPVATAKHWVEIGATRLHLVDLDGARSGTAANRDVMAAIRQAVAVPIQIGGGLRSLEAIRAALDLGADRAIVGTAAIEDQDFLDRAAETFGAQLVLGIDARNGLVATRGWESTTSVLAIDLARRAAALGIGPLICTDIGRDGTLGGPNVAWLAELVRGSGHAIIASGGVSSLEDLNACRTAGCCGAIVGRAIYDGTLDLGAAITALGERTC